MKIGIISEGHSDRAVVTNLIVGATGLDANNVEPIRPIYNLDETDKANINPLTFSSWSVVKHECEKRELINGFLAFEGQDFVVIHIDTAESEEYGIKKPDRRSVNYCTDLRMLVVNQINVWLNTDISSQILYAVAIEETDAWVLTIHDKKDSAKVVSSKEKLARTLAKKNIDSTPGYDNYLKLSKSFSKDKEIEKGKYLDYNCSLYAFYEEIKTKVVPKL